MLPLLLAGCTAPANRRVADPRFLGRIEQPVEQLVVLPGLERVPPGALQPWLELRVAWVAARAAQGVLEEATALEGVPYSGWVEPAELLYGVVLTPASLLVSIVNLWLGVKGMLFAWGVLINPAAQAGWGTGEFAWWPPNDETAGNALGRALRRWDRRPGRRREIAGEAWELRAFPALEQVRVRRRRADGSVAALAVRWHDGAPWIEPRDLGPGEAVELECVVQGRRSTLRLSLERRPQPWLPWDPPAKDVVPDPETARTWWAPR